MSDGEITVSYEQCSAFVKAAGGDYARALANLLQYILTSQCRQLYNLIESSGGEVPLPLGLVRLYLMNLYNIPRKITCSGVMFSPTLGMLLARGNRYPRRVRGSKRRVRHWCRRLLQGLRSWRRDRY
mgnify:FL=1